jgi:NAD(P)-dependent dehydrogenase (short-subunit alcohol dehydrogenase family)
LFDLPARCRTLPLTWYGTITLRASHKGRPDHGDADHSCCLTADRIGLPVDLAGERVVVTGGAVTIGGAAVRLFSSAPLGEHTVEDFGLSSPRTHRGVFLGLTHVLPRMSSGASVVNTASSLGLVGAAGISPFRGVQARVIGLTKSAALEVATRGIRVNAVCPEPIAGPMIGALERPSSATGHHVRERRPDGQHGRPEEVASLVAYLLSDEAQYISGTAHEVDGAFTTTLTTN